MKKYPLLALSLLFLMGCSQTPPRPSLDERLTTGTQKTVTVELSETEKVDSQKILTQPIIPNLTLKDETQVFEKYLPILMFHYIEEVPKDTLDQTRYGLSVSPERLEEFLIYFKENNIQTLTFWDMVQIANGEMPFPEKAVILTFDDGHKDHYTEAFPLLQKYGMKGVFFIISGKPDLDSQYANWQEVIEMAEAGHEIGSHAVTHPNLTTLSPEAMKAELEDSKRVLEEKIGKPVISFAYPSGKYDQMVSEAAKKVYVFARTTHAGKDFSLKSRAELPTTRIFPETGLASLRGWFE